MSSSPLNRTPALKVFLKVEFREKFLAQMALALTRRNCENFPSVRSCLCRQNAFLATASGGAGPPSWPPVHAAAALALPLCPLHAFVPENNVVPVPFPAVGGGICILLPLRWKSTGVVMKIILIAFCQAFLIPHSGTSPCFLPGVTSGSHGWPQP